MHEITILELRLQNMGVSDKLIRKLSRMEKWLGVDFMQLDDSALAKVVDKHQMLMAGF
jgi:hypothetical protein